MFHWNDDEIANIIWDEGWQSDDHVVPLAGGNENMSQISSANRKGWNSDATNNQSAYHEPVHKTSYIGCEIENYSQFCEQDIIPSSDLMFESYATSYSVPNGYHDSSAQSLCNNAIYNSARVYPARFQTSDDTSLDNPDQGCQSTFLDYPWMTTGTVHGLEDIFNSEDPIFSDVKQGNAGELWPLTTNIDDKPSSSFCPGTLRTSSGRHEQYASLSADDLHGAVIHGDSSVHQLLTHEKELENSESLLQNYNYPMNCQLLDNQLVPCSLQECVLSSPNQGHLEGPAAMHCYHEYQSFMLPSFVNGENQEPQHVFPTKINLSEGNLHIPVKHYEMTPQEKIEKLKRKRQKEAEWAIMRQKDRFNNQLHCNDPFLCQQPIEHTQTQQFQGSSGVKVNENSSVSASNEQNINILPVVDSHYSNDEATFLKLKVVVGGLDSRTRLCIRDSLFRLAQRAVQRHSAVHSNNNGYEPVMGEEINTFIRGTGVSGMEKLTNPIDRTSANLLFFQDSSLSKKWPPNSSK